jgi:hypothetical protein
MQHQRERHGRGGMAKRRRTEFLRPCLLQQPCGQDRHGYELLQEFIVGSDCLDPSIV